MPKTTYRIIEEYEIMKAVFNESKPHVIKQELETKWFSEEEIIQLFSLFEMLVKTSEAFSPSMSIIKNPAYGDLKKRYGVK